MLLKKPVSKRKTRRTAEHTVKPEKLKKRLYGCEQNVENHIENETVQGNALFFVVQSETESGCPRSKLSGCPKMMVGMLLESCGRTETAWPKKKEGGNMLYKSSSVESWQAPQELQLRDQWLSACHGSVSGS